MRCWRRSRSSTDLVVLPEMFTTGFSMESSGWPSAPDGPTAHWLQAQAARLDAAITGSVITTEGEHYYNRLLWAAPGGEVRHYDKRHLFRMADEHQHFTPGGAAAGAWRGAAFASARWSATTCAFRCSAVAGRSSTTTC